MAANPTAKFKLGHVVATPNALQHVTQKEIANALRRHSAGDWGNVCNEDAEANTAALVSGARLLSVYTSSSATKFWVLTEADRSATTILLPEDY